ncbi:MAG: NADH:ubiquinone reductase (Na(+)-transporting) subunit B [Bacteroidales bacterium]|nr:NADH:ubiquinone reductase (Na(+)-transporting) subunit B [Bacteroidales bacterium]
MEENKSSLPAIFEKGGKLYWLHSTVDAFDTFLRVPATVTKKGAHVRDAVDLKRLLIIVVFALVPAAVFGMWNVGYQHNLATGATAGLIPTFFFGFWKVLPLFIVSYVVGLAIEFAFAQINEEELSEGYLVSGFLIPLIVPVNTPLWILAIAVAFAVVFGKEVFGGTGYNFLNPALLARAFLFFAYPSKLSGSACWIATKKGEVIADAATGATPLSFMADGMDGISNAGAQYGTDAWSMFAGIIPGSVGETSVIAILLGAIILIWTGVASWKIMVSSVAGALAIGGLANVLGGTDVPAYYHLIMGGFAFGTVFMATDPVTAAQTECGKWIYGFLIGALCVIVRLFNPGYAEGMMLAILLCNTLAPLIDHCVVSTSISRRAKKANA